MLRKMHSTSFLSDPSHTQDTLPLCPSGSTLNSLIAPTPSLNNDRKVDQTNVVPLVGGGVTAAIIILLVILIIIIGLVIFITKSRHPKQQSGQQGERFFVQNEYNQAVTFNSIER